MPLLRSEIRNFERLQYLDINYLILCNGSSFSPLKNVKTVPLEDMLPSSLQELFIEDAQPDMRKDLDRLLKVLPGRFLSLRGITISLESAVLGDSGDFLVNAFKLVGVELVFIVTENDLSDTEPSEDTDDEYYPWKCDEDRYGAYPGDYAEMLDDSYDSDDYDLGF